MKNSIDETIYKDFRRYGEIYFNEDYDFTKWGGNFITVIGIKLNHVKRMFILVNGEVTKNEIVGE